MLRGYPHNPTATLGSTLRIHVANDTNGLPFCAHFYRQGATLEYVFTVQNLVAYEAGMGQPDEDWSWPSYDIPIPSQWKPGVYVVLLFIVPTSINPSTIAASQILNSPSSFLFVLQNPVPGAACILYKLPLFTYHAYNEIGSPAGSLYAPYHHKVSLRRPGGGCGGQPFDASIPDAYDTTSHRQTFAHWDAPFISWLENSGYDIDYCTDLDVHQDSGALLSAYRLLLSVGHDEYWSPELRAHIEAFISNGGNVAFFSGNTCWWRVHLTDNDSAFTCDKDGASPTFDQWYVTAPENIVTGVSYRNAGGRWDGTRQLVGFTVQYSNHWVFQGTGLADGNTFGQQQALVGYECDGAQLSVTPGPQGYELASNSDGTPDSFVVLGVAHLDASWEDWLAGPASAATMGIYTRNGTVFTAATTDWSRVLDAGNPEVVQITRNVLDKLRSRVIRIRGISTRACGPIAVEGAQMSFTADTGQLPSTNNLGFSWTSTAPSGPTNLPTLAVTLPSPPVPVTITVTVKDGTACSAFGTLTFTPVTTETAIRMELMCLLRDFAIGSEVNHKLLEGARDRFASFVDPIWDPIRGELTHMVFGDPKQVRAGLAKAKQIAVQLERLGVILERSPKKE
jgi:hypothetical protein